LREDGVYPELFSVGHFPVATYGVVLALAVLAGGSLIARGFFEAGLPKDEAWSLVGYVLIGGLVGGRRVPQIRRSGIRVRRPAPAIQAGEPELR
jgi:prolipoprotein diacylglyceryltransferase